MRVDDVNQNRGIGYIKFNSDTEMDLIAESMDRLIQKQQKLVETSTEGRKVDVEEQNKLDRFKKSKDAIIERPREKRIRLQTVKEKVKTNHQERNNSKNNATTAAIEGGKPDNIDVEDTEEFKNMNKVAMDAEKGSSLSEGSEVTHRNMHVLINALNDFIWDMEKDELYKKTRRNQLKYDKLRQMLENAQQQKAQFERVRPKPKGFGRLRK